MKNIASFDEITNLKTTDIYFLRVKDILQKTGEDPMVTMEITSSTSSLPWIVLSGLDDFSEILRGENISVFSLPEGTLFPSRDMNGTPIPAMKIVGNYSKFGMLETAILGCLSQASGIASKASLFKKRIGDLPLLSFGVRRMHPALAPLIDRNSYLGGCDKVSSIIGAERIGVKAEGTMPHSLLLLLGEKKGWELYDQIVEEKTPRIALVDTFGDEKESSLRAARTIENLSAVRLDTPASRRGNFPYIVREVRWELDRNGFKNVGIIVSGGIKEEDVECLKKAGVSGFGVGTAISNAATIDFAMDIVSVNGKSLTKKGKFSGDKNVFRCKICHSFLVSVNNEERCPEDDTEMESVLTKIIDNGNVVYRENLKRSREFVIEQLGWYELS